MGDAIRHDIVLRHSVYGQGASSTDVGLRKEVLMPSKTAKQKKFMAAAAHNPAFAKKAGISQSVAKEFNEADARKGKKRK